MPSLKEILDNAQYADNLEFTDPNGVKFSMADLRSLSKMAEGEKQVAAQKRSEAEKLAAQAATLLASLEEQAHKVPTTQTPPTGDDWRKDPFYQPVATELDKFNGIVEKLNQTISAQQKALDNAQAIYALERMRSQYNAMPEKLRSTTKFEDLAKQAVEGKHVDRYNLPTLDPLIEKLTEPDRMETFAQSKIAEAKKQWEQEQMASSASKPGSSARFRTQKSDKPPIAKIEDLNSEVVMNDPDVRAAMEGPIS